MPPDFHKHLIGLLLMKHLANLLPCVCVLALTACGGSSGGSDDPAGITALPGTPGTTDIQTNTRTDVDSSVDTSSVLTGRFVDSAVSGLQYATATQTGVTGTDGSFSYLAGEQVTFSIGDINFPATQATDTVTPLNVFSTTDIDDTRVVNMARLLQSLDTDGNPDNGITISPNADASATGLFVDFNSPSFDSQVINLVANSGSGTTSLIDGETALEHFQETLFEEGIVERPVTAGTTTTAPPATTTSASSNPLVGTTASFRNFTHGIGGTMTLVDDRTIQITNFTYDGGGPAVYFYLGTDGGYSPSQGGRQIGPKLNGRIYDNETITLTLPADVTLNDFNGISVWCELFFVNFGDATF